MKRISNDQAKKHPPPSTTNDTRGGTVKKIYSDCIPASLKNQSQWVLWKLDKKKGKIPYSVNGRKAAVNRPETWATAKECVKILNQSNGEYAGVGWVFTKEDGYCGIDLDGCRDPENGGLTQFAQEILTLLPSYTEISPSGKGLHIIIKGKIPRALKRKEIEFYDQGRFFTVTGDVLPESKTNICELKHQIKELYRRYTTTPSIKTEEPPADTTPSVTMTDEEILKHCRSAKNREKFNLLYDGRWSEVSKNGVATYHSQSEADFAFCELLTFYTQNTEQIDRLVKQSKLYRPKWDERRGRATYGETTIDKALERVTETYKPGGRQEHDSEDEVFVAPGKDYAALAKAEKILFRKDPYCLFAQGTALVTVSVLKEMSIKKGVKREKGTAIIDRVSSPHRIIHLFNKTVHFYRYNDGKNSPVNPPLRFGHTYLALPAHERKALPINKIINCPTMRADGSILDRPGYDPQTGLYFHSWGDSFPPVDAKPSKQDAIEAIKVLKEPFKYFPFVTEADKSVVLAALLTSVVRPSLGSAPLFGFTAPTMGSGKTLLCELIGMIATGKAPAAMPQGKNYEEDEKRIVSFLLAGDSLALIDNCLLPIGGDALSAILTASSFQSRLLGFNKMVKAETNVTIMATGNNLSFAGDMTTRALLCTIDPGIERPEEREFVVDARDYVKSNRAGLVHAALTILKAYHEGGRPKQSIKPYGRFEEWHELVRSALVWLGEEDPCLTRDKIDRDDPVQRQLKALLENWYTCFQDTPYSLKGAIEIAKIRTDAKNGQPDKNCETLLDVMNDIAGSTGKGDINARKLGNFFMRYEKRRVNSMHLARADEKDHNMIQWRVRNDRPK